MVDPTIDAHEVVWSERSFVRIDGVEAVDIPSITGTPTGQVNGVVV